MRIYAMTATFGKLQRQTLTLEPGLNVVHAPNEWGKSTWCAFLCAMLYGLDTRSHSTKSALSDRERYAPWSGVPMSGRIDLEWQGRHITIQRRTKGRAIFGDFTAYETASGIPVPELTGQNCGQQLLGVEKTVFTRSALIRQADLPVTQDEALRRRLTALVTTGDDSGTTENLERKLRELKNRCRYNRTGLLPQAEAEAAELDRKLSELDLLERRSGSLRQQCAALEQRISDLENHQKAVQYQAARQNARLRREAEARLRRARDDLAALETQTAELPDESTARQTLADLQDLQSQWVQLRMDSHPADRETDPLFPGMSPEDALSGASADADRYRRLRKWHPWIPVLAALLCCAGVAAIFLVEPYALFGYIAAGIGAPVALAWAITTALRRREAAKLAAAYGTSDPEAWIAAAQRYTQDRAQRQEALARLQQQTRQLCQDQPLSEAITHWQGICRRWNALEEARQTCHQHRAQAEALSTLPVDAPPPDRPDGLTLSEDRTRGELAAAARELREFQHRLGQCQGQMVALGHRTLLESRREALQHRIRQLEDTYAALELALATLEQARADLQRRFAPRITARAQALLKDLSAGRYDRLVLGADLTVHATAEDEDTLRSSLWRSDGTVDLLYLALRLAVAGELTPEVPLILDDALMRFDDRRLERTMAVLKEEARHRQIILFTCHSRELQYL